MHFHFSPFDGQLGVLIFWERKKSCSLEILLCAVEVTMTFCGTDMSFLPHIRPLTAVAVESRLWIKCHSGVKKKEVFEVVKRKKTLSCHRGKMPFWVRYVFVSWFFFFYFVYFSWWRLKVRMKQVFKLIELCKSQWLFMRNGRNSL